MSYDAGLDSSYCDVPLIPESPKTTRESLLIQEKRPEITTNNSENSVISLNEDDQSPSQLKDKLFRLVINEVDKVTEGAQQCDII